MKLVKKLVLPMLIAVFAVCVILATPIFKADAATTYYTVAGTSALCGSEWNPSDTKNDMTAMTGGYYKIYQNVPAGSHEFKVTKNHSWTTSWGSGGNNYKFSTTKAGYVAIYFKTSGSITVLTEHGTPKYRIAGTSNLCGSDWNNADNNNLLTVREDGLLTKTYTNVSAGSYELKVVKDANWNTCWGNNGNNYQITLTEAVSQLTVTFNVLNNKVAHTTENAPVEPPVEEADTYVVAGSASLCGSEWNPSDANNQMTKQADGTYKKVYTNVAVGNYEFKIVKNGDWETCWGNNGNNVAIAIEEECDKLTIIFNPETGEITYEGKVATADVYVVAGSPELCGSNWSTTDTNNQMTKQADGTYTKVYPSVAKGNYSFKVVKNGSTWIGNGEANFEFGVSAACDVTITYNPSTGKVTYTGTNVGAVVFIPEYITAVGNGSGKWLNGQSWNVTATANRMTEVSDGVYSITFNNVSKGSYELKFAANGSWNINWGGQFSASGVESDAWFNSAGNIKFNVSYYTANITITLNISNYSHDTKNGAKFSITITDSHTHSFSEATCTAVAKCVCGATQGTTLPHTYDHACDVDCNVCGATRTPSEHAYDHACDVDCNVCGATRTPSEHVYDHACDVDCNVCGATRTPSEHAYDHACDVDCNVCGATRTPADHVYDHACDVDCNVCGATRTPADHVYDNNCDADCNVCGATRTPADHVYDNGCDAKCNECDASREELTHTYSDEQDKYCDICGFERHDRVVLDGFKGCQGYVDGIIAVLALAGLAVVKAVSDKSKK